jgi:hypothetical protein
MNNIQISFPLEVAALWSSVFTEVCKLIPFIKNNEVVKTLTAIFMTAIGAWWVNGFVWDWITFASVLIWSFANYKMIVQPVANSIGASTQK